MTLWLLLLALALLGTAYFSGSETAVVTAGRLRHRAERDRGRRMAGLAERLYRRPEHTLSVLLLGTNLVNVLASIAALILTEHWLAGWGLHVSAFWGDLLSALWVSPLVLLLGEILPKSVGRHYAFRLSRLSAPLLLVLYALLLPLLWVIDAVLWLLNRLPGLRGADTMDQVSWDTVRLHLEAARAAGVVGVEQERAIQRIGLLGGLDAERLMRPLESLCLFPASGSAEELRRLLLETQSPQAFLYEGRRTRISGVLPARRLLGRSGQQELRSLQSPLPALHRQLPALEILDSLQPTGRKLAVVTDTAGEARGILFLEDLLRELLLNTPGTGESEILNSAE
jgi:putative hemolysin